MFFQLFFVVIRCFRKVMTPRRKSTGFSGHGSDRPFGKMVIATRANNGPRNEKP